MLRFDRATNYRLFKFILSVRLSSSLRGSDKDEDEDQVKIHRYSIHSVL